MIGRRSYIRIVFFTLVLMLSLALTSFAAEDQTVSSNDIGTVAPPYVLQASTPDASAKEAHIKIRELMDAYPAVDYYRKNENYYDEYTDAQENELMQVAVQATSGAGSDYDKIKAVCKFVAENIYYDYMYYNGIKDTVVTDSYGVWKGKITVCAGYERLCRKLLQNLNIPCMCLYGDNHAYSAAYDSQSRRWIFFDSTWCSGNRYTDSGELVSGSYSDYYFDMSDERMAGLRNHEVLNTICLLPDESDVLYELIVQDDTDNWFDQNTWRAVVSGPVDPNAGSVVVKSRNLGNISVDTIVESAFDGCSKLESVTIGDGIKTVEWYAFYKCGKLSHIDLPESVTTIGEGAFEDCNHLISIILPENLTVIDYGLFDGCSKLKRITIPQSIVSIGEYAFDGCDKLSDIYYCGSKTEWKSVKISNKRNYALNNVRMHYNTCCRNDHIWETEFSVDKESTPKTDGEKAIHCSKCGAVKEDSVVVIPKMALKGTSITKIKAAKKAFTAKWKKNSGIDGYQIQYALKSNFKDANSIYLSKKTSKKISGLKSGKKYYIRIRTYKDIDEDRHYSLWSSKKSVKVK